MILRATAPALTMFLTLALVAPAFASSGNAAAGKAKAEACAACHGDGNTTKGNQFPKLAGQYPDYLSKALHEYKSGKRKNPIMGAQAKSLQEQDIADLAAYFGSLQPQIHDLSGHQR